MAEELLSLSDAFERARSLIFTLWIESCEEEQSYLPHPWSIGTEEFLSHIWLYCAQQVKANLDA